MKRANSIKLGFLFIFLFSLFGCSGNKIAYRPKVFDEARILKSSTIKAIENNFSFPPDIPVYIRTVENLTTSKLGYIAIEMMENESYWAMKRPKSWLSKLIGDPPHGTGIYILLSRNPRLIQIRYGDEIGLQAHHAGLAAGKRYLQIQEEFLSGKTDEALLNAVKWISTTIPHALDLPWYLSVTKSAIAIEEFKDLSLPSDGLYTSWLFKPYISITTFGIKLTQNPLSIPVTNAIIYLALRFLVINLIIGFILQRFLPDVFKLLKLIVQIILGVILSFPSLGSMLILSQGRLEDKMTLSTLGITLPENTEFITDVFSVETGFVFALFVVIARFADSIATSTSLYLYAEIPDYLQKSVFEKEFENNPGWLLAYTSSIGKSPEENMDDVPYRTLARANTRDLIFSSIKWYGFLLFMPKAISLYALAIFLVPFPYHLYEAIFKKYSSFKKGLDTTNNAFQQEYGKIGKKYKEKILDLTKLAIIISGIILAIGYDKYLLFIGGATLVNLIITIIEKKFGLLENLSSFSEFKKQVNKIITEQRKTNIKLEPDQKEKIEQENKRKQEEELRKRAEFVGKKLGLFIAYFGTDDNEREALLAALDKWNIKELEDIADMLEIVYLEQTGEINEKYMQKAKALMEKYKHVEMFKELTLLDSALKKVEQILTTQQ